MGQYYTPLIRKNGKYTAFDIGHNRKLMEHSWIGRVPDRIAFLLYKNPAELAWVGDYATETDWEKTFYEHTQKDTCSLDDTVPLNITAKYIINLTKHEYIDMKSYVRKLEEDEYGIIHPLSLMTVIGNGRGGGDYFSPVYQDKVGSWAGDIISVEDEYPQDFTRLDVWFTEDEYLIEKWKKRDDLTSETQYIKAIEKAAEEIESIKADNLIISDFGEWKVTVKIDINEESIGCKHRKYDVTIYAPQSKENPVSSNKLKLGAERNIDGICLHELLEKIYFGNLTSIEKALKHFNLSLIKK